MLEDVQDKKNPRACVFFSRPGRLAVGWRMEDGITDISIPEQVAV